MPVPLPPTRPVLLEVYLVEAVHRAELYHPFYANVHHVTQCFLRDYFVHEGAGAVLGPRPVSSRRVPRLKVLILKVEHIQEGRIDLLLANIWANYHTKEWKVILVELFLESCVRKQVHV